MTRKSVLHAFLSTFEHNPGEIIGRSDALKYVLFRARQVAPTDATVLLQARIAFRLEQTYG